MCNYKSIMNKLYNLILNGKIMYNNSNTIYRNQVNIIIIEHKVENKKIYNYLIRKR